MNSIKRIGKKQYALLLLSTALIYSCKETDMGQGVKFEPYKFEASASTDTIRVGETVTFTDKSTNIQDRSWAFPGGEQAATTDPVVTVAYQTAGTYQARLTITYKDQSVKIHNFPIIVKGKELPPVVTGPTYGVFTELELVTPGINIWFITGNGFKFLANPLTYPATPFEGKAAQRFTLDTKANSWGMVMIQGKDGTANLSEFVNGYLNFAIKSTSTAPVKIRIRGAGLDANVDFGTEGPLGIIRDGNWHMISLPMSVLLEKIPEATRVAALQKVADLFMIRSVDGTNLAAVNNFDFDVDNVFYSVNKPTY